jgi:16S rRNA (guanine(527)-N(7))-methyltransferase RsmG
MMNNREWGYRMSREQENEFRSALETSLSGFGIDSLSETQASQLVKHYSMLREWNRRINLTRITEPEDAARLHYADSLFGGGFIHDARTLLDIGSGAGFPAIPLAVLRPDVQVTALEANQKKSLFLNEAKDALKLANFKVATARVESFNLTAFDLLVSRALDRAESILPSVISGLKREQRFMLYCAPDLLAKLYQLFASTYEIEAHTVPETDSRLIAIFSASRELGQKGVV